MPEESLAAVNVVDAECLCRRVADAASLAGRLAHDFDNLLMGVMGYAELALAQTAPGTQAHHYVSELYRVARRGLDATRQMHDLSSAGRAASVANNLAEIWKDVCAEFLGDSETPATVTVEFDEGLPPVVFAAVGLRLVLRHLLANAVEAAPEGEVSASAKAVSIAREEPAYLPRGLSPGSYVQFCLTDSGPGLRSDALAQMTTSPLYTTKPRRRGLGLSIIYRALDAYGGGVRFESAQPRGTRVTLMLPADAAGTRPSRSAVGASQPASASS